MPTVRVRRNTYTPLPENGGNVDRTPGPAPIALGEPIGMTQLRRGSDGRDESYKSASPPLTPTQDGGERRLGSSIAAETQSAALPEQDGATLPTRSRQRSGSNSLPPGRSRSRTIQSIVGSRYVPPMPMPLQEATVEEDAQYNAGDNGRDGGRARSSSGRLARIEEPAETAQARTRRASLIARERGVSVSSGSGGAQVALAPRPDRSSRESRRSNDGDDVDEEGRVGLPAGRSRSVSNAVKRMRASSSARRDETDEEEHHLDAVVEHLDVIDPQIGTVSSLQNCANAIMIPPIPSLWSRKPVLTLPDPSDDSLADAQEQETRKGPSSRRQSVARPGSIHSSTQSLTAKELSEDALDKHVEHVLRKRDKAKRVLKGLWAFVKTPMGFITAVYGFLVAFWGAAIVLFLLGWINTGSDYNKKLWIEISSQVENGLFTITGVGLIPWRVTDAYRIFIIWRLKRLSTKLRKKRGLPPITNPDDLPDPALDPDFVPVLTEKQQAQLQHQQTKFMASQTWYRPHATETHRAFPISWGVAICFLMVGNSAFQCILCGCMWGLNRFNRPAWTTGSLIPLSFLCGIAAAVVIWKGGEKTKKKDEVEAKLREALGMDDEGKTVTNAVDEGPDSTQAIAAEKEKRSS